MLDVPGPGGRMGKKHINHVRVALGQPLQVRADRRLFFCANDGRAEGRVCTCPRGMALTSICLWSLVRSTRTGPR